MRVVLITIAPRLGERLALMLRSIGHDPVALLTVPNPRRPEHLSDIVANVPEGVDVVVPHSRARIAPLLRTFAPDVALCSGFGWRIPPDALEVPRYGIVNGHPSLLPRWRGPNPFGWTFRADDPELGYTFHLMDSDFDTGPTLAQGSVPLSDEDSAQTSVELLPPLVSRLLPAALDRIEAGDRGDPQPAGGTYASVFEDDYAEIDWARTAREVHNQVRSWFIPSVSGILGAHTTLDGERVRVTKTQLVDAAPTVAARPGSVVDRDGDAVVVQCGDRPIRIIETEPAAPSRAGAS
jgi:methionyl-tRNA formyltransferase